MIRLDDLRERLRASGAKPAHERLLLRAWSQSTAPEDINAHVASALPKALRAGWPTIAAEWRRLAQVRSQHPSARAGTRLLVELADGETVETVLLPRQGACVSTQVGCAVGCTFCMSGRDGVRRHLGSAEIVAQAVLARTLQPVRKVVLMGMGEPAHNLDEVMDAIAFLGTDAAFAHKDLVLSTVGDRRVFERLAHAAVKPALALSLHTVSAAKRAALLPRAPRIDPRELLVAAEAYARATHYPTQVQWTLIDGINDADDEIDAVARLLAGHYAVLNLIPYNAVDGLAFRRPPDARAHAIVARLSRAGVLAKLRDSAAQDVDGGCGQLRVRAAREVAPIRLHGA